MTVEITANNLRNKYWRLNHLYRIIDKDGQNVRFRCNRVQRDLFDNLWYLNIILKARQEGFTTFIDLYMLDECLFNPNVEAGIVAHNLDEVKKIFRRKIEFPYENLDPGVQKVIPRVTDSKSEMGWNNGSMISVGLSLRGGTLQYLHISELGKIARTNPEKAREIVTGAVESVGGQDTMVFIESTGEGKSGVYYDLCDTAQKLQQAKQKLTRMDYNFNFVPWFFCPDYVLREPVAIKKEMADYFREIQSKTKYKLSTAQKAWYIKKRNVLHEDVKREYPSIPEEAFESGIQGTFFRSQFIWLRENNRITKVPVHPGIVVDTWWDLGRADYMSIWFTQDVGREIHAVYYYENNHEGFEFYRDKLDELVKEKKIRYGRHVGPHDIEVQTLEVGSRKAFAARIGINFEVAPKIETEADGIQASRSMLQNLWFDEENCSTGLEHLEEFRHEWDAVHGVWKATYLHDEHSHGAKAFETLAMGHSFRALRTGRARARKRPVRVPSARGWT